MQALGLIETRGLLPAIECADAMLKTAQVELVERTFVGGGLVTISVTGDVGAVKAAVEAGAAAVAKFAPLLLVTQHVIPRPHQDIKDVFYRKPEEQVQDELSLLPLLDRKTDKKEIDQLVQDFGLEKSMDALKSLPVLKLRNLAREYKGLTIAGRAISKANKKELIQQLKRYYDEKHE